MNFLSLSCLPRLFCIVLLTATDPLLILTVLFQGLPHDFKADYIHFGLHLIRSFSLPLCTYFQSRGSRNSFTGPTSDRYPDKCGGGGYTFIDSSFPRRPGDVARLSSLIFPPNGTSLGCLKR